MEIHYTWPSGTGSTLNEAPAVARAVHDVGLAFAPFARDQNLIVYGDANSLLVLLPGGVQDRGGPMIRPALPQADLETVVALTSRLNAKVTAGSQPMAGTRLGSGLARTGLAQSAHAAEQSVHLGSSGPPLPVPRSP